MQDLRLPRDTVAAGAAAAPGSAAALPEPSGDERQSSAPAGWSTVPRDTLADQRLSSHRVGYFAGVFLLLSAGFYLRNALAIAFLERTWPPLGALPFLLHLGAIGVHGSVWLACRNGRRSLSALRWIDALGLVGAMALYGGVVLAEASALEHAVAVQSASGEVMLVAVIMLALVLTHAIIVPLDVRRMFWLSLATCAVALLSAYLVATLSAPLELLAEKPWLPVNQLIFVAMWALLAVVVSSIAARVIHGLQQRVREANEIGQYLLEERIGEGGMGIVYLARHALLRRPTAVKLLHPERAGEQAVRRFEQEVRLTSTLTHPNTIAIYDFGRTPDGVFYYAMEYLDGLTLEDLVSQAGAQPPARVVQILKQICGSLAEAHAHGLIHRDIKPANVMLCVRGGMPDQIKVLDFGLVKEHAAESSAGLSIAGALLGTPMYLAPESIQDPSRVDGRSDLYAVGAVGYYLLVGAPVFESDSLLALCVQHLHSEPVAPSQRAPGAIPAALDALILRCLAKAPAARPASALELIELLGQLGDLGSWSSGDAQRWWQQDAPRVVQAVKAGRSVGSTPGPRTVAVDLERRSPSRGLRA
jgi:serine/threonine-protein kinase